MKRARILLLTSLIIFTVSLASAAQLYWDPSGSDSGTAGGSGNWDTNDIFWFNGTTDIAWTNANNDDAYFSGTANTVTLTNDISAGDIYFTNVTGNYVITNLTGAEVLTVASTIDTGGGDHTIGALLAGSGTLNKNGDGTLHLPANNATVTGSVMINQGAVSVENNNSLGSGSASITVAPGAALEFNGGANVISATYNSITAAGTGVTNSGAFRNVSGGSSITANITLTGDTLFDSDNGRLSFAGGGYTMTASGNNSITAAGLGNVYIGSDTIDLNSGSVIVDTNATLYMYVGSPPSYTSTFGNVVVDSGATYEVDNDNGLGTVPATLMKTNLVLDGGTLANYGAYTMSSTRGITITANGGTITNMSGTWTTCDIYSSNAPVTIGGNGNIRPGGSGGTVNLGTGTLIKVGPDDVNTTYASSSFVFSNMVLNGGSLTFNYDYQGAAASTLGAVPSAFCPSNIVLNGGALHAGHSTTINPVRGIFVGPNGGTILDQVSSGGTVTIDSVISGPGSMNFPSGLSGSHVTGIVLAGNNTYAGTTTIGVSNSVTVGSGSTTGTLGTGNTIDNWTLTFNRTGSYTYGGNISGSGTVIKNASGTVTLAGNNTYTNTTTVGGGALLIDGTNGTGAINVNSSGVLGGTGLINGAVTVNAGGTLALGSGNLSISNNVSIGGNISVSVNKSLTPSSGMAIISGTITRSGTGTLTVANAGPALASGDTFQIFNQKVPSAGTMAISGGGSGGYSVTWVNNLANDGSISVQSLTPSKPSIKSVQVVNGSVILSGSNGPDNGTAYVLTSTNLALPLSQWTYISTNSFLSNGQFSITNPITPGMPQQFYLLLAQ